MNIRMYSYNMCCQHKNLAILLQYKTMLELICNKCYARELLLKRINDPSTKVHLALDQDKASGLVTIKVLEFVSLLRY